MKFRVVRHVAKMAKGLIRTLRPNQWYKNTLIFMGIVFSLNILNLSMWLQVVYAFLIFCALSGSEYIINDILDVEKDRRHPIKSKRPIASGELKVSYAISFSLILIVIALAGAYWINLKFFGISILFLLLTLSYSFWLKHIILVDALMISINFVIRATAGCLAINVAISPWITICALLLALFLAFGKRRHEVILLGEDAKSHRKILGGYSTEMLDMMIGVTGGALIVAYSLHTFLTGNLCSLCSCSCNFIFMLRHISHLT